MNKYKKEQKFCELIEAVLEYETQSHTYGWEYPSLKFKILVYPPPKIYWNSNE